MIEFCTLRSEVKFFPLKVDPFRKALTLRKENRKTPKLSPFEKMLEKYGAGQLSMTIFRSFVVAHSYLETHLRVISKHCRPRSDAT